MERIINNSSSAIPGDGDTNSGTDHLTSRPPGGLSDIQREASVEEPESLEGWLRSIGATQKEMGHMGD